MEEEPHLLQTLPPELRMQLNGFYLYGVRKHHQPLPRTLADIKVAAYPTAELCHGPLHIYTRTLIQLKKIDQRGRGIYFEHIQDGLSGTVYGYIHHDPGEHGEKWLHAPLIAYCEVQWTGGSGSRPN
jgi:hypothetical protein